MEPLQIGIAGDDRMQVRTMAISREGRTAAEGEPTVGFTSIQSPAKALSQRDHELPAPTAEERGDSMPGLAAPAGCGKSKSCRGR